MGDFLAVVPIWNDHVGWRTPDTEVTELVGAGAVPVFLDGCGNLFGLDLTSGAVAPAVYFFDHEGAQPFERPIYAAGSSLGAFLLLLAEHDRALQERRPAGWELSIDPDIGKCPRAPPLWLTVCPPQVFSRALVGRLLRSRSGSLRLLRGPSH